MLLESDSMATHRSSGGGGRLAREAGSGESYLITCLAGSITSVLT